MFQLPKLAIASRINAKGEGYFQSFLSPYATTHRVKTLDDVGIDYFCEWLRQETEQTFTSSNVLFAVQLKSSEKDKVQVISKGADRGRNYLEKFELKYKKGGSFHGIKPETEEYWRGFDIPVYLFVVLMSDTDIELYYKRYTPILHGDQDEDLKYFYKASSNNTFLAFATKEHTGGFCRDLFIDYIRCNYKKGSIAYKNPREMGLGQFPEGDKTVFVDMAFKQYKAEIQNTYNKLKALGLFMTKSDAESISSTSTGSGGTETLLIDD